MTNIQRLLDDLGTPPQEVCLDWAWQLHALHEQSPPPHPVAQGPHWNHSALSAANSAGLADTLTWRDIEIDRDGQLVVAPTRHNLPEAGAGNIHLERLIIQLVNWADQKELLPHLPHSDFSTDHYLPRLTLLTAALPTPASPKNLPPRSRSQTAIRQSSRTSASTVPYSRQLRVTLPAAGLLLTVGLIGLLWLPSKPDSQVVVGQSGQQMHSPSTGSLPSNLALSSSPHPLGNGTTPTLMHDAQPQTLAEEPIFGNVIESLQLIPPLPSPENSSQSSEANSPVAAQIDNQLQLADASPDLASPDLAAADIAADIMGELSRLSHSADELATQQTLTTTPPAGDQPLGPLALPIFPMNQLQQFEDDSKLREPIWKLRIVAAEEFAIAPRDPQSIVGRQFAKWTLQFKKADGSGATVDIHAQLSSNRDTSIRWNLAATSPDFAGARIPLSRPALDDFQLRLGIFQRGLQSEIDRLRSLGRTDGLRSEMRSAVAAQRNGLEGQAKIAGKLMEFVASANQLTGLLDGQIEVHAALFDSADSLSTPILQFGEPFDSSPTGGL